MIFIVRYRNPFVAFYCVIWHTYVPLEHANIFILRTDSIMCRQRKTENRSWRWQIRKGQRCGTQLCVRLLMLDAKLDRYILREEFLAIRSWLSILTFRIEVVMWDSLRIAGVITVQSLHLITCVLPLSVTELNSKYETHFHWWFLLLYVVSSTKISTLV